MSTTLTTYTKKEIEKITRDEVNRMIEPYEKIINDIKIRIIDLERMFLVKEKSK